MFWRWWAPWDFMNTEPGKHESQFEALSQRLFGHTFWGDYAGDIITRYYYSELLSNYPLAVGSIQAMHGQGLVLIAVEPDNERYRDQLREVIRFLAFFDRNSPEYGADYFWGGDDFSEFEWQMAQKEISEGWWGEYNQRELSDHFNDWADSTMVPEAGTTEWAELVGAWFEHLTEIGEDYEYPYFEGADSVIVPGWDPERVAEWMLEEYARSITEAGNPEPLNTEI